LETFDRARPNGLVREVGAGGQLFFSLDTVPPVKLVVLADYAVVAEVVLAENTEVENSLPTDDFGHAPVFNAKLEHSRKKIPQVGSWMNAYRKPCPRPISAG
jgi:hypothetical protein